MILENSNEFTKKQFKDNQTITYSLIIYKIKAIIEKN